MGGETNLSALLRTMTPVLQDGQFVFCTLTISSLVLDEGVVMLFREAEGITVICRKAYADEQGYAYEGTYAWIALQVHSSLAAVGLTAAFSAALGQHEISCNVVAGFYHDHIFVPTEKGEEAVAVLKKLTQVAS